jgi:hypothetical protein
MEPKWNNIFTYQRQRTSGSSQLENNVTKNLLKLIQDTDGELIRELANHATFNWDSSSISTPVVETQQEIAQHHQGTENTPYLLGISRNGCDNLAGASGEKQTTNIIDGIIDIDSLNVTLYIEVKTGSSSLSGSQLLRYANELGLGERPDQVEQSPQFGTLTWRSVYGMVSRIENEVSNNISKYLHQEFAKFLEYEQLETTLASNDGDYPKRLRLQRCRDPDHKNWEAGELIFNLRWEDDDKTSNVGEMSAIAFNQLLGGIEDDDARGELRQLNIDERILDGIPTDVRRDIFAGETVRFKPLEDWVFEAYPGFSEPQGGSLTIATTAPLPDGNTRRFNVKYRNEGHREEGRNLSLRYVRYGESNNYHQQQEAILDPVAFEQLFNTFPQQIRRKAFCGEPAVEILWEAYVNDDLE